MSFTAHLYSTGTVDEVCRGQRRHERCEQADQPRCGDTDVRHPTTIVVSVRDRMNNLDEAFKGDDHQAVHGAV